MSVCGCKCVYEGSHGYWLNTASKSFTMNAVQLFKNNYRYRYNTVLDIHAKLHEEWKSGNKAVCVCMCVWAGVSVCIFVIVFLDNINWLYLGILSNFSLMNMYYLCYLSFKNNDRLSYPSPGTCITLESTENNNLTWHIQHWKKFWWPIVPECPWPRTFLGCHETNGDGWPHKEILTLFLPFFPISEQRTEWNILESWKERHDRSGRHHYYSGNVHFLLRRSGDEINTFGW